MKIAPAFARVLFLFILRKANVSKEKQKTERFLFKKQMKAKRSKKPNGFFLKSKKPDTDTDTDIDIDTDTETDMDTGTDNNNNNPSSSSCQKQNAREAKQPVDNFALFDFTHFEKKVLTNVCSCDMILRYNPQTHIRKTIRSTKQNFASRQGFFVPVWKLM